MSSNNPRRIPVPFLREIPLYVADWGGVRNFLVDVKSKLERFFRNYGRPAQVTGLAGTAQDGGTYLVWNITHNASTYRIYRGSTFLTSTIIAEVPGHAVTLYTDVYPLTGSTFYWVSALNDFGEEGALSDQISVTRTFTFTSGTYTPTLTGVVNVAASTAYVCQYLRVGNTVTVSGKVEVDPTAAAAADTQLGISLPVASNFAQLEQCVGTSGSADPATVLEPGVVFGDTGNDRATLRFAAATTANHVVYFHFTYTVL